MIWPVGFVLSERYKTSGRNKKRRDYVVAFPGIDDAVDSSRLVGAAVEYRDRFTRVRGRIVGMHGRRGRVRVRFLKPLPGQYWRGRVHLLSGPFPEPRSGQTSPQTA